MVYIGGMRNKPEEVAEVLGLPPRVVAVFGMCIGYEDDSRSRPASAAAAPARGAASRNLPALRPGRGIAAYNQAMARFYEEQGMNGGSWADHSAKRVAGPETLSGDRRSKRRQPRLPAHERRHQ